MSVKKYQAPEEPSEPSPHISPEMLRSTLHALESRGTVLYGEEGAYVPTEKGWKLLMSVGSNLEEIEAHGHPDISATDGSAIKIVTHDSIKNDRSVVCVKADKSCAGLNKSFKENLQNDRKLEITFDADDLIEVVGGYGSPALKLSSIHEIEIRKDDEIHDGTVAIFADRSASDFSRDFVEKLKNPKTKVKITLSIK